MPTVDDVVAKLEQLAPLHGAEEWDNVGLLVGDRKRAAGRVMTCLTLTPATVAEAIDDRAELVVVHHPLPFRPISRVTSDTTSGRMLWDLIGAGVGVYSAHTAFDSAGEGINQQLAVAFGLCQIAALVSAADDGPEASLGSGRCGNVAPPISLAELADRAKDFLSLASVRVVGHDDHTLRRIAVACGSGGSFLDAARIKECDCLVTGETSFHTCLEAEASGVALVLVGHFASERFAMERLADELAGCFPELTVWASRRERDPLRAV